MGKKDRTQARKDKIMASVVTTLEAKFGTKRSKEQLRKRWSDIKSREPEQYWHIKSCLKKVSTCVFLLRYLTCMLIHIFFVSTASFIKTILCNIHMIL
ncbi:hypothetical protein AB205_0190780 [Aquarana catesbeiana]|uniref:Myb/SANT-like DNA-binding domain-containing protein n=1 Tax=Aquarana catesbeiana TaxID=8400 RepID=A0A2G9QG66_AQUCT|nr:hypothetical protein AB205_0190780 [Aquarana catesbeiana]